MPRQRLESLRFGSHRQTGELRLQLIRGLVFRAAEVAAGQVSGSEGNYRDKKQCEPALQLECGVNRRASAFGARALHLPDGLLFAADAQQEKHTRSLL